MGLAELSFLFLLVTVMVKVMVMFEQAINLQDEEAKRRANPSIRRANLQAASASSSNLKANARTRGGRTIKRPITRLSSSNSKDTVRSANLHRAA